MAVEARQVNLFPSRAFGNNRELMMNDVGGLANVFNSSATPFGYGVVSSAAVETVVPAYASALSHANVPAKIAPIKSDSGLTYAAAAVPVVSRKRPRDDAVGDHLMATPPPMFDVQNHLHSSINTNNSVRCAPFTFLGEDISLHLQQQQLDLDRFVAQHMEKARIEIEERRKRHFGRTSGTIEESAIMKKLKAKEEEFEKIGKLNSLLEERVKSLSIENQIWRDLAQTNEATANALRSNLEQVLAQVQEDQQQVREEQLADDAQSCCASNSIDERGIEFTSRSFNINGNNYLCKSCGREESCVLLLPCRHLCLCTVCGSSVHTCPVCCSAKTASLHVNLST